MKPRWKVGIDVGGTFTDVVALDLAGGEMRTAKVQSRTSNPSAGLRAALAAVGLEGETVSDFVHGTTLITNAIVEDQLARVALITTKGFGDSLVIGRQNRKHLYRLDLPPKPVSQVPAERRIEIRERLDAHGNVLVPMSGDAIDDAVERALAGDAEAVAVSFLHAYANPIHEQKIGAALDRTSLPVALSHQINPEAREYERTATTVLSASLMPLAATYMEQLQEATPEDSRLHLFHSSGGMASPASLRNLPLGMALSGPAAGVAAACKVSKELGISNAVSLDMGGTTTDVSLIVNGQAQISADRSLGDRPLRQLMVDVVSIGAGGGSIARLNLGVVQVGPDSAGAYPGPAGYGEGGTAPTVTDANLVLGYLEQDQKLGESIRLDVDAARNALSPLAKEVGVTITEAAYGILRVANANMVRSLNRVTVERGIDGRACGLLAFGGAGPMHAVELARSFGINRVIVPAFSSAFSAVGCAGAEISYAQQQTLRMPSCAWDAQRLSDIQASLVEQLMAPVRAAGHRTDAIAVEYVASIRYRGQSYAIEIPTQSLEDTEALSRQFQETHTRLYGFATDEPWELYALRCTISAPTNDIFIGAEIRSAAPGQPRKTAPCWFGGNDPVETARYERSQVGPEQRIAGPAIIEDAWSTIVLPPGASAVMGQLGHIEIDVGDSQ